jgi:hypothetical protein
VVGRLEVKRGVLFSRLLLNSNPTSSIEVLKELGVGVVGLNRSISISIGVRVLN